MRCKQGRLRKDLRLTGTIPGGDAVIALALEAGFNRVGIVAPELLSPCAARRGKPRASGALQQGSREGLEWDWVLHPERWAAGSSVLVCCLSCFRSEPDDLSSPDDPHALIAPFARANYYGKAVQMLRAFGLALEKSYAIPHKALRLFSNSRIPEKPLLAATGLGALGHNGLAIVRGLGSLFVIAGVVLPVATASLERLAAPPAVDPCGSCRLCMKACPVGAITEPGRVDPDRCLQGSAGVAGPLPDAVKEAWGARLYGCQECQSVCPHNKELSETALPAPGEIGPSLSLRRILSLDPAALKRWFRGTAMGMSWVTGDSLMRNALLAAGNRGNRAMAGGVERFCSDGSPLLREAARWALERMGAG